MLLIADILNGNLVSMMKYLDFKLIEINTSFVMLLTRNIFTMNPQFILC